MKPTRLFSSLFSLTLCLAVLTSAGFAKNNPLSVPYGLAVDAAGNLYVGNEGSNNILIYNSAYAQQTSKTITQGINLPGGVAIDPYGNLWVANNGNNTITEYTNGVQDTANTITNGISFPTDIAFDGLDNLWVKNAADMTIYGPTAAYAPPSQLLRTFAPASQNDFTVGAGVFVYGTETQTFLESASATLLGNPPTGGAFGFGSGAMAPDNSGNIYVSDTSSPTNVFLVHPNSTATLFVTLPFTEVFGIALDNVKKRVYISNPSGDEILVYSTAGALLHTIHN